MDDIRKIERECCCPSPIDIGQHQKTPRKLENTSATDIPERSLRGGNRVRKR